MSNKNKEDIYDVSTYTEKELYDLLDLNHPTDRELEAKIIFMIKKYDNINNDSGKKLAKFFTDIYNHFFDDDADDTENDNQASLEEEHVKIDIVEGFTGDDPMDTIQVQTATLTQKENKDPTQPGLSAQLQTSETNINFIKPLDYAADQINPLLNQTTKKIISIDSQYRDDKTSMPTEFAFNLSAPLKDVVSLKLYSVHIPYTWYTIGKSYGSNFFYLKGNVPGIENNPNQYMMFDISVGNYTPQELVNAVNDSINGNPAKNILGKRNIYTDVSFGSTSITYNNNTSLASFNIDIRKQYNENSFYLYFEQYSTPNKYDGSGNMDYLARTDTITSFLGFNRQSYDFNILNSYWYLNYYDPSQLNDLDDGNNYYLTSSNNSVTIIKYISNFSAANPQGFYDGTNVDLSFNLTLSLALNRSYSRNNLFNDLSNQIFHCPYLSNESYIKRINMMDPNNANYGRSYFQLKLKPNRYVTNNLTNSKLCVSFPYETTVWSSSTSCFGFSYLNNDYNEFNEMNLIQAETTVIPETINYVINGTPKILLTCTNPNFVSYLNNIEIDIKGSTVNTDGYTVNDYITAINNGITDATSVTPFLRGPSVSSNYTYLYDPTILPEYTWAYMDDYDKFNLFLNMKKTFDVSTYRVDFSGTFFSEYFGYGEPGSINLMASLNTISVRGYMKDSALTIVSTSQNMPQIDTNHSDTSVQLTFDISGVTYGNSPIYGNIYIVKDDNDYSENNINNNWQIPSYKNGVYESYEYVISEYTYTVSDASFSTFIDDQYLQILSRSIDVSSNGFSIPGDSISFSGNFVTVPSNINNIYFDDMSFVVNGQNLAVISDSSWSVMGNSWTIDTSNNWTVNGNTFLTTSNMWSIANNNGFTVSTNIPLSSDLTFSGTSLILRGNSYNVLGTNILDLSYQNLWKINATTYSLSNEIFTVTTSNAITYPTPFSPMAVSRDAIRLFNNTMTVTGQNLVVSSPYFNFIGAHADGTRIDGSGTTLTTNDLSYVIVGTSFNYRNSAGTGAPFAVYFDNVMINDETMIQGDLLYITTNGTIAIQNTYYTIEGNTLSISYSADGMGQFELKGNLYDLAASATNFVLSPTGIRTNDLTIYGYNVNMLCKTAIDINTEAWNISASSITYNNNNKYIISSSNQHDININASLFQLISSNNTSGVLPEISYNNVTNTFSVVTRDSITTDNIIIKPYSSYSNAVNYMAINFPTTTLTSANTSYLTIIDTINKAVLYANSVVIDNTALASQQSPLIFHSNLFRSLTATNISFTYQSSWSLVGQYLRVYYYSPQLTEEYLQSDDGSFTNLTITTTIANGTPTTSLQITNANGGNETYSFDYPISYVTGVSMGVYTGVDTDFVTVNIDSYVLTSNAVAIDNVLNSLPGSKGSGILYFTNNNSTVTMNGNTITTPTGQYFSIVNSDLNVGYNIPTANIKVNGNDNNLSINQNIYTIEGTVTNAEPLNLTSQSNIVIKPTTSNTTVYMQGARSSLYDLTTITGNAITIKKDVYSHLYHGSNTSSITVTEALQNLVNNAINIFGNRVNINNGANFSTTFNRNDYPSGNIVIGSSLFTLSNTDTVGPLTLTNSRFTASYRTYLTARGNALMVGANNTNWSIISTNLQVYDQSFQFMDASFTLPGSNFVVTDNLIIDGNQFSVLGNIFLTPSEQLNLVTTADYFGQSFTTRTYTVYGSTYTLPENSIKFQTDASNYVWTPISPNGFSINDTLQLSGYDNMNIIGTTFTITSQGNNNYKIYSPQYLDVSADTVNVLNGGTITFVGRQYLTQDSGKQRISVGSATNLHDFSINIVYARDYCPMTNLLSTPKFLGNYAINPDEELFKIYPRFTYLTPTFGNEVDVGYVVTNKTGKTFKPKNLTQLQNAINIILNNYTDAEGKSILFGSQIILTLNTKNPRDPLLNCNLNLVMNKTIQTKDYAIEFVNYVDNYGNINQTWTPFLHVDASMVDMPYGLANTENHTSIVTDNIKNQTLITATDIVSIIGIQLNRNNNVIKFVAYDDGTISNDVTITLPIYTSTGTLINYSRDVLIRKINSLLSTTIAAGTSLYITTTSTASYVSLRPNINLIYTSNSYNLVFYDTISFVKCYVGAKSIRNTTWDTTVGWILGFRANSEYDLSQYPLSATGILVIGDTGVCTNLFNYFLLCIDDYTQNHVNDGLVTITSNDTNIPLPSYADRANFTCNPVTNDLNYNNIATDYAKLTQNQIYSLTQLANNQTSNSSNLSRGINTKSFGNGPYVQDVFGLIPVKTSGLPPGGTYVEFGGTLQNQDRIYFGPVNIHRMSIKLVTDRGDIVDLNDVNWSFSLICEQLYKQRPALKSNQ